MLKKVFKSYDYTLIFAVILLCLFGLVMVYSASMVIAVTRYEYPSDFFYQKQKISLLIAMLFFIFTLIVPYKVYAHPKILMTIVFGSVTMLFLVFVMGHTAGNAQSWIRLGSLGMQPSEFTKLSVILYLAAVYAKKQSYLDQFDKGVLPPILITIFICILVVIQPDFGTAFIIFLIGFSMIVSSGIGKKSFIKLGGLTVIFAIVAIPFILLLSDNIFSDERMSRIMDYTNPFKHEETDGYQLTNAYIAIGSGGLKGLGLGEGVQKYGYLPESHTDFIMAVVAEELGLFGVIFVLLLLSFIVLKGFLIARKCDDSFGSLLAIGISSMIGIQSFINLGGVTGIIPITGVPLPFISYGGSSLLLLLISMGILINISMRVNYRAKFMNKEAKKTSLKKFNNLSTR